MKTHERRRRIEKLLFEASPHSLDYLRALRSGPVTYGQIAAEFNVTPKTVSAALKDLNDRYKALVRQEFNGRGVVADSGLIEPKGRTYGLTAAGKHVARSLELMHTRTVEAFESALSRQVEVWLQVANDCWGDFKELTRLVSSQDVVLLPQSIRSSELDLHLPHGREPKEIADTYALYSACLEGADVRRGQVIPNLPGIRDQNTTVIVTHVAPFQVLAPHHTFAGQSTIDIKELLKDSCQLVVPQGGAVRDFLDLVDPTWTRWVQHVRASDFEGCSGVLQSGCLRSPAMIVHGFSLDRVPQGFGLLEITHAPKASAVRGLYHRQTAIPHTWSPNDREIWNQIWSTADRHWRSEAAA